MAENPRLYQVMHPVLTRSLRAIWRPEVTGREHVPRTGGVLLASNHLSFVDSIVIPSVVPRRVVFLTKSDYFTGAGVRGALKRAWFEGLGMLPVDREDGRSALASLDTAKEVLNSGLAFGIYPEGTRSRDGRLGRGRTGVAQLALTTGVPVVPMGLRGTENIQPVGSRLPRLAKVSVAFGPPIVAGDRFADMASGRARRELTDEVMAAIAGLSGQELSGVYHDRAAGV